MHKRLFSQPRIKKNVSSIFHFEIGRLGNGFSRLKTFLPFKLNRDMITALIKGRNSGNREVKRKEKGNVKRN